MCKKIIQIQQFSWRRNARVPDEAYSFFDRATHFVIALMALLSTIQRVAASTRILCSVSRRGTCMRQDYVQFIPYQFNIHNPNLNGVMPKHHDWPQSGIAQYLGFYPVSVLKQIAVASLYRGGLHIISERTLFLNNISTQPIFLV